MPSDDDLSIDELVEQITVDAYGDEGYWSFLQAFDDHLRFPLAATVLGVSARVTKVDFDGDERRGITAIVTRDGHTSTLSLLDAVAPRRRARRRRGRRQTTPRGVPTMARDHLTGTSRPTFARVPPERRRGPRRL